MAWHPQNTIKQLFWCTVNPTLTMMKTISDSQWNERSADSGDVSYSCMGSAWSKITIYKNYFTEMLNSDVEMKTFVASHPPYGTLYRLLKVCLHTLLLNLKEESTQRCERDSLFGEVETHISVFPFLFSLLFLFFAGGCSIIKVRLRHCMMQHCTLH